jgi:hypothetical protein
VDIILIIWFSVSVRCLKLFTFSPEWFSRKALTSYKDGMELTALDEKGDKINTSLRVDQRLKDFYSNLPDRMRSKLIKRSMRTYIKNKQ